MKADWSSLKRSHSGVRVEQLLKVLSEYQVCVGQERPGQWDPPDGELDMATWTERLTDSFSDHPPLQLPSDGFTLDLREEVLDPALYESLRHTDSMLTRANGEYGGGVWGWGGVCGGGGGVGGGGGCPFLRSASRSS